MTERTQHDDDAPGSSDPARSKAHTFDLIDEVPGASGVGTTEPDEPDDDEPDPVPVPDEPESREPGRMARALAGARAVTGRAARRGVAVVRRRLPGTRRGRLLLAGGTAVVVVLAVVAWALVDAQVRHRDLIAAPGGVRSLAEKPAEQWSVDLDNPLAATLVEMPGVLAIVGDSTARGVDPASGEVRWSVDVGEGAVCGPTPRLGIGGPAGVEPADPLVCVTTADGGGQGVTVIEPDGATTSRELDDGATVLPGPGGGLIQLALAGDGHAPQPVVVDKVGTAHLPKGFVVPDLTVRVEDAATGTERWSATVESGDPQTSDCLTYNSSPDDSDVPTPVLDVVDALTADLSAGTLEVEGCGVAAAFLPDGTRLDDPDDATDPPASGATGAFAALPGGGWIGPGTTAAAGSNAAETPDVAHLPDGRTVQVGGQVLVPWATDGRDPGLLLARAGGRTEARSTEEGDAGTQVWSADRLPVTDLLARVSGTAVVVDERGPVRAVDLGTGAVRWTLAPEVLGVGDEAWDAESTVFGAYTDGDTLLLPVTADPRGDASGLRLVAVDLGDGSVRWEIEQDTPYTQLVSVDGYLAQITQQGVVGLG